MKRIRKNEQYFDIDFEANAKYYDSKITDRQPYARNFCNQMRNFNPEMNDFIDMFAADIIKPDKLSWEDTDDGKIRYSAKYFVKGTIIDADNFETLVRKMRLSVEPVGEGKLEISLDNIVLPWILIESKDGQIHEVESHSLKAKLKGFFKK